MDVLDQNARQKFKPSFKRQDIHKGTNKKSYELEWFKTQECVLL